MSDGRSVFGILDVLSDLMRGGRHSRHTVSRGWGISLPTADRWIAALLERVPGVTPIRIGREKWLEFACQVNGASESNRLARKAGRT